MKAVALLINPMREVLTRILSNEQDTNRYNYAALGIVASLGHVIYGLYWTYIDPQPYESVSLRAIGVVSCLILLTMTYWPVALRQCIPTYWVFAVTYNLPFFFTVNLINNGFSDIWFVAEVVMVFTVILFIPTVIHSLVSMLIGIVAAIGFCWISSPESVYWSEDIVRHLPIYLLSLGAGYIFSYSNTRGIAMQEGLKHKLQLKATRAMAGSIAHEMRSPLASIRFQLQQIKKDTRDQQKAEYAIEQAELSIQRSAQVIDLIMASLQNQKIACHQLTQFSAHHIIYRALEEYALEKREKKRIQYKSDDDFYLKADETLCIYVLFNLLKNALYYTDAHSSSQITISTSKGTDYNIITVSDTGPGIDPEVLPYLFDDFFTHQKSGGTGLGLSYCRRVMEAFGGSIHCSSVKNEETRFSLSFPVIAESDSAIQVSPEEENLTAPWDNASFLNDKTLLIVDDQPIHREILKEILSRYPVKILEASHARQALEHLQQHTCDLVLSDIHMPETSGIELARQIHLTIDQAPPIIGISGDLHSDTLDNSDKAGITILLKKPINATHLLPAIAAVFDPEKANKAYPKTSTSHKAGLQQAAIAKLIHDLTTPIATLRLSLKALPKECEVYSHFTAAFTLAKAIESTVNECWENKESLGLEEQYLRLSTVLVQEQEQLHRYIQDIESLWDTDKTQVGSAYSPDTSCLNALKEMLVLIKAFIYH